MNKKNRIHKLLLFIIPILIILFSTYLFIDSSFSNKELQRKLSDESYRNIKNISGNRKIYWKIVDRNLRQIDGNSNDLSNRELLAITTSDNKPAYLSFQLGEKENIPFYIIFILIINMILFIGIIFYAQTLQIKYRNLRRESELSKNLAYLGELSRGLAHELRNPLNTITMNLEMIASDLPSDEHIKRRFDRIRRELKRLEDNLTNFLRFARPPELRLHKEDLNELVENIVKFFYPECRSANINLEVRLGHGIPKLLLDKKQIEQAILNLLLNAKLFTKPQGTITVTTGEQNNRPYISISDTGSGIAKEELSKLFSPYYTRRKGGSGVGLAFVKRIMKEHMGDIRVESEKGRGTEFILFFKN